MYLANSELRYGAIARGLHWVMAALLIVLIGMGLYMVSLPDAGFDKGKITLILMHKELGILALATVALRFAWRLASLLPRLAPGLPDWQQVTARFVHLLFYVLMFALPMTGWLMSSAGGYPVPLFAGLKLPDLIGVNEWLFETLIAVHRWLAYALGLLLVLHAGAALHHHFVRKDDTLGRMLSGGHGS